MEINYWKHQLEAELKSRHKPGFAYFMEMGTGKTGASILGVRNLFNEAKRIKRSLIFAPPLVVEQWPGEWQKFSKIEPKYVVKLQGPQKKRVKTFLTTAHDTAGTKAGRIFVTNYEALLMKDLFAEFCKWEPEVMLLDESQNVKSHDTQRSQLAYDLANPWDMKKKLWAPRPKVYLLSGTPVLNAPLDIFQQFKIMLGGFPTLAYIRSMCTDRKELIENYFHFRGRYFRDRNAAMPKDRHFPKWEPMTLEKDGFDAMKELEEIIDFFSYRKLKSECLDLPEEVSVQVPVGMSAEQARMYEEMKTQLVTYLDDKACVAQLAITKALRLLQIASGFVSLTGQGDEEELQADVQFQKTPKEEALKELLKEITPNAKVLVWAVWKENYKQIRRILDELGIKYVEAHGEVKPESKKHENVKRFQEDPSVRVFLGNPASGGTGLNLVQASYSIFFSRTFNLGHYLQARARNHRGGSKEQGHEKITHYDLACKGTIDEVVLAKLASKQQIGAQMLGDLKKELAQQVSEY